MILGLYCLGQVAILRATRRQQEFGDSVVECDEGVEFTVYGAEESVEVGL